MGSVTELDSQRPHYAIHCACGEHVDVVPVLLIERLVRGDLPLAALPECVVRAIVRDWLALTR